RYLGEIEHAIIESYFKKQQSWDEELHRQVSFDIFSQCLEKNKINLVAHLWSKHFQEVLIYSKTGIDFLLQLKNVIPEAKFKFEQEYSDDLFKGRVDLIVETSIGKGILDFKRSAASVPSNKQHQNFEKIQMWSYLAHGTKESDLLFWGYISLKEIQKSLLYTAW